MKRTKPEFRVPRLPEIRIRVSGCSFSDPENPEQKQFFRPSRMSSPRPKKKQRQQQQREMATSRYDSMFRNDDLEAFKLYLASTPEYDHDDLICDAVRRGCVRILTYMSQQNLVDLSQRDKHDGTVLSYAIKAALPHVVYWFLDTVLDWELGPFMYGPWRPMPHVPEETPFLETGYYDVRQTQEDDCGNILELAVLEGHRYTHDDTCFRLLLRCTDRHKIDGRALFLMYCQLKKTNLIDLSGWDIGDAACKLLSKVIRPMGYLHRVRKIDLSNNPRIGPYGCQHLQFCFGPEPGRPPRGVSWEYDMKRDAEPSWEGWNGHLVMSELPPNHINIFRRNMNFCKRGQFVCPTASLYTMCLWHLADRFCDSRVRQWDLFGKPNIKRGEIEAFVGGPDKIPETVLTDLWNLARKS